MEQKLPSACIWLARALRMGHLSMWSTLSAIFSPLSLEARCQIQVVSSGCLNPFFACPLLQLLN